MYRFWRGILNIVDEPDMNVWHAVSLGTGVAGLEALATGDWRRAFAALAASALLWFFGKWRAYIWWRMRTEPFE